jgi:MFS family permease
MEQLDSTIINTGIPAIASSLGVTPLSLKAVVTRDILSLAVCIPISGWLANRYGSRRIFLEAMALFIVSSILRGLAPNATCLLAARVPQGIAAAMMMPVGRIAIMHTFPKAELLRAMNFVILPALLGPLLGPTVGGLIVHWLSWRDIFFVNVPVRLAALWFGHRHMPDYRGDARRQLDWRGLALFASGAALLMLALGLLGAYAWHAKQVAYPLLRLSLLRIRTFRVSV